MGLGLYVVQEITKAHGGRVEVESNETLTRFSMRLPRKRAAEADWIGRRGHSKPEVLRVCKGTGD